MRKRCMRPRLGCRPVDPAAALGLADRKRDVFGHTHPFDQPKVLVNKGHRLFGRKLTADVFIERVMDQNLPPVRRINSAQNLDQD